VWSAAAKLAFAASSRESWPEVLKLWALGSPNKSATANGQEPFASAVNRNAGGGSCPSLSLVVRRNRAPFTIWADLRHEGRWQQGFSFSRARVFQA
jgi:hypothetical protein